MFFSGNHRQACTYMKEHGLIPNMLDKSRFNRRLRLKVMRKKKSQRLDPPWIQYIKQHTRHYIETVFSSITSDFPKSIHAVTYQGFLLKVQAFIFAFTLEQAFI
jgi:hypothetical protein